MTSLIPTSNFRSCFVGASGPARRAEPFCEGFEAANCLSMRVSRPQNWIVAWEGRRCNLAKTLSPLNGFWVFPRCGGCVFTKPVLVKKKNGVFVQQKPFENRGPCLGCALLGSEVQRFCSVLFSHNGSKGNFKVGRRSESPFSQFQHFQCAFGAWQFQVEV